MSKFMINDACCKERPGGDPEGQDCLDKWKEQLEEVCNEYNEAAAETVKEKEAYENSLGWEIKIKSWNELIQNTDEKAKTIVTELDFLIAQVKIVCDKAFCTNEALKKLLCLVKGIFDCFYSYTNNAEGLKDKIAEFKKEVECLKNIGDDEKADVLKCIETYEEKIMLVCEMQDAILSKLIETLKCAKLLYAAICKAAGLKTKLQGIKIVFNGETPEDDEHCDPDDNSSDPDKSNGSNGDLYPCDDKAAKSIPEFPISEGGYYKGLGEALEKALEETANLKDKWITSKTNSDAILSKKKGLEEAIKAAEAAESGK
ncbi:MAG: hypothetical protein AAFZ89_14580 [Bacteroidota bacterium]